MHAPAAHSIHLWPSARNLRHLRFPALSHCECGDSETSLNRDPFPADAARRLTPRAFPVGCGMVVVSLRGLPHAARLSCSTPRHLDTLTPLHFKKKAAVQTLRHFWTAVRHGPKAACFLCSGSLAKPLAVARLRTLAGRSHPGQCAFGRSATIVVNHCKTRGYGDLAHRFPGEFASASRIVLDAATGEA